MDPNHFDSFLTFNRTEFLAIAAIAANLKPGRPRRCSFISIGIVTDFFPYKKMDLEIPSTSGHVQSSTYAHCGHLPPGFFFL